MGGEAKHVAAVSGGGACHGHIGGHVLHGVVAAAGPPVVAHGVASVEGKTQLRMWDWWRLVRRLVGSEGRSKNTCASNTLYTEDTINKSIYFLAWS